MCAACERHACAVWQPIVFIPFETGVDVHAGGALATAGILPALSPCRAGYEYFCGTTGVGGALGGWCDAKGRSAWDLQAVLYAVRGHEGYYTLERGSFTFDDGGGNWWFGDENDLSKNQFMAWLANDDRGDAVAVMDAIGNELDSLLVQGNMPKPPPPPAPPPFPPGMACAGCELCAHSP